MIVESINNPQSKYPLNSINSGERMLVLKVSTNLSSQDIFYTVINQDDINLTAICLCWDNFKIICDKMPSNWVIKYKEDKTYGKELELAPSKWLDASLWTFGFWEALYCGGDTGYEKLSSKEEERAKQVFLEESRKIYEECGKGWVPNPFE